MTSESIHGITFPDEFLTNGGIQTIVATPLVGATLNPGVSVAHTRRLFERLGLTPGITDGSAHKYLERITTVTTLPGPDGVEWMSLQSAFHDRRTDQVYEHLITTQVLSPDTLCMTFQVLPPRSGQTVALNLPANVTRSLTPPSADSYAALIARAAHEANLTARHVLQEEPTAPWDELSQAERDQLASVVQQLLDADTLPTPDEQHDAWCLARWDAGWQYSPVYDASSKLHPDLQPFNMIPFQSRMKTVMFLGIIGAARAKRGKL